MPWPSEWANTKKMKWYFGLAWIGFLALVSFVGAAVMATGESPGSAKYLLIFGLLFVTIMVVGFDSRVRLRKGGGGKISAATDSQGRPATNVPYSRIAFAGSSLLMALLVAIFAAATYDFASSVGTGESKAPLGAAVVFGAIGLFFATYFVQIARKRIARGHLLLTPHGLEHRSWGYESQLPWNSVMHVSALNGDGPEVWIRGSDNHFARRRTAKLWGGKPPRAAGLALQGKSLGVDPALVYYMISYYLAQPSARAELGTEAAIRRAQAGSYF
ncbi:hypothetical protein [Amycolatopsis palatopharyngis]|uniref:hypothetical protein n=1 Tax=Amycolatopsis palatopharyngis TaxID=187982 RepID=UPI0013BEA99A|nr:hypothetical protein [Amycolatopsis palatopharyngis]